MKKHLIILIISVLTLNCYGQNLRKDINFVEKNINLIKLIRPISDNRIVCVTEGETYIRVRLYDKEFNEIGTKEIQKNKEVYLYHFRLKDNYLYISNAVKAYDGLALTTIHLDPEFKTTERLIEPSIWVGDYHVNPSGKYIYYSVSENFNLLNTETKKVSQIKPNLEKKEKALAASKFQSFKGNNKLVVFRSKKKGMKVKREVAVYDEKGNELLFFPKLENGKNKINVYAAANNEDIYFIGNYKDNPSSKEIYAGETPSKKPNHTGIFIKSTSKEKAYEKFYQFSDFKELDKNVKDYAKFNIGLEKISFLQNENVAFCTIYEDIMSKEYSQRYGQVQLMHIGKKIKYILIFAFNNDGNVLWDKVIPLNDNILKYNKKVAVMFDDNFLTVDEVDNTLQCHYSYNDGINYFEINNDQIVNQKKVNYTEVPQIKGEIGYKYKHSSYWYDNYYFSWNIIYIDKIEFNK